MDNHKATLVLAALFGGAVLATVVYANDDMTAQFGTPVRGNAGRTVTINGSTQLIRVEHLETLTIRNKAGQSFAWQFDTFYVPTGFPLTSIAPSDFEAGSTWVYVRPLPDLPSD